MIPVSPCHPVALLAHHLAITVPLERVVPALIGVVLYHGVLGGPPVVPHGVRYVDLGVPRAALPAYDLPGDLLVNYQSLGLLGAPLFVRVLHRVGILLLGWGVVLLLSNLRLKVSAFHRKRNVDAADLLPIIIECDELLEVVGVQVLEDEYGIPDQLLIREQGLVVDGELHLALPRNIREGEGLIPLRVLPALRRGLALLVPGHVQAHEDGHLEELGLRDVQGRLRQLDRQVVGLFALLGLLEGGLARLLGARGDQELGVS